MITQKIFCSSWLILLYPLYWL